MVPNRGQRLQSESESFSQTSDPVDAQSKINTAYGPLHKYEDTVALGPPQIPHSDQRKDTVLRRQASYKGSILSPNSWPQISFTSTLTGSDITTLKAMPRVVFPPLDCKNKVRASCAFFCVTPSTLHGWVAGEPFANPSVSSILQACSRDLSTAADVVAVWTRMPNKSSASPSVLIC